MPPRSHAVNTLGGVQDEVVVMTAKFDGGRPMW